MFELIEEIIRAKRALIVARAALDKCGWGVDKNVWHIANQAVIDADDKEVKARAALERYITEAST